MIRSSDAVHLMALLHPIKSQIADRRSPIAD
jgi:hypothetical protein